MTHTLRQHIKDDIEQRGFDRARSATSLQVVERAVAATAEKVQYLEACWEEIDLRATERNPDA